MLALSVLSIFRPLYLSPVRAKYRTRTKQRQGSHEHQPEQKQRQGSYEPPAQNILAL